MSNNDFGNDQHKKALLNSNAFFKKKAFKFSISILIVVVIVLLLILPSSNKKLVIKSLDTDEILWQNNINAGDWFYHRYIHSVEKSPVIEKFMVNENYEILTMESWTKSFGAGMPYEREGKVEISDGYYILRDLNRPVHGGVLRIKPSGLFPHTFHFKDQELTISESPFVGHKLLIEIQPVKIYEKIIQLFT
ncbi:DUF1850 domain-containing protein [Bacillaceae bacterium W0354]